MGAKKKKYYVVWEGRNPGIYETWADCQLEIKGWPGAKFKSFPTKAAATEAFRGHYADYYQKPGENSKPTLDTISPEMREKIVWDSIAVDAACSSSSGEMEYQGVDTRTGARIFHQKFSTGTNNIGEFLALVHALAMLKKQGKKTAIYTDSRTAMAWVRKRKANTTFKKTRHNAFLFDLIARAEKWLRENTWENPILKWDTENWGEIPADFGRK
ncbi:MAG: ribonuclease H [Bacteroidetes bacterium]|nr:MAG: ribonuclease H [Bacteroidota bacterium]